MSGPTQMAGSCATGMPARITLKRMLATRLIVGHMMRTVQHERTVPWIKALSRLGSVRRAASAAPPRVPHRFENKNTKSHMYEASTRALGNTSLVMLEKPPGMVGTPIFQATL